jgi:hypothetical protein
MMIFTECFTKIFHDLFLLIMLDLNEIHPSFNQCWGAGIFSWNRIRNSDGIMIRFGIRNRHHLKMNNTFQKRSASNQHFQYLNISACN